MNTLFKLISFLCLIYLFELLPKCLSNNDVIGCGGFVKSVVNINYNKIVIKLLTNKGIVKYTTDCAPNNGYYFIPLYDKGLYQLKIEPPNGWTFDPMFIDLNFDGKTDLCSQQNDINFSFKGFTVSGKVFSDGSTSGPSGVSITLRAKSNNNVMKTTLTSNDGFYEFKEVLPGDYVVEATHHSWKFKKSELQISVVDDNIEVSKDSENNLSIFGYEVVGNVMSEGEPIQSVLFAIFSRTRRSLLGCDSKQIPIKSSTNDLIYLCHVSSDENGLFRFPTVPVGSYVLIPFYGSNNIKFDVSPKETSFEVFNENIRIDTVFQIEGFSVSGRVHIDQKSVPNAEINFRDQSTGRQLTVTTQSNGIYNLENVKTGNYMITVMAKHLHFDPVLVKISPVSAIIPDISPNAFDVCGTFILKSTPLSVGQITILFKSKEFSESITSDLSDGFCIALRPDTFTITHISSDKNFKLIASQNTITVKNEPILNLKFTQFTATLSGVITTKDSATDLQLKVFNKFDNQLTKTLKFSDFRKVSTNKLEFKIENLLPASYRIHILKDSDSWCWLSDTHSVDIIDKDVSDIEFIQKGYILSLFFSHLIEFDLKYPSNKVEKLRVGSDHSLKHCVTETGIYTISPKGCHKFSESANELIAFDTKDSGKLISRTAVKHLVSANVITNLNVTDIVLTVKIKSFGNEEFTQRLHLEQNKVIKGENQILFEYLITIWAKPMVNLFLEPSSSQLLFKPNSFETKVENECLENAVTFSGKIGVFIDGQITPKLEGVVIKIMNSNNDQILLTTKTDSLGKYMAGAFDSDIILSITAEKEGYFFKDVANKLGHFSAIRLSQVSVRVTDDNKEPLSDVLISISGGAENYRKNSVTPSTGILTFNNLHSGEYFLRVMMKEYDFEPSSQMITVSDGSDLNVEVSAKKVAFSCIGVTDSLNGEPEPGVVVEAIGLRNIVPDAKFNCSQLQEEAISEANGSFRVKGLRPECQYAIRIKSNDERNKLFNQTIPRIHLIRVEDRDVTSIRLIIFRKSTQLDVSGDVVTPFEHLPSLKVRLYSELNPDQSIAVISLTSSPFFFLPALNIDNRNYFIRLESSLSSNLYEFETPLKSFRANTSHLHLTFTFNPKSKDIGNSFHYSEYDVSHGSVYVPIVLILIGIAFYNYSKIYPFLVQFLNFVNRLNNERTVKDSDQTNSSLFSIKRKTKSKKI